MNEMIDTAIHRLAKLGDQPKNSVFDCPLQERVAFIFGVQLDVARELCLTAGADPDHCEKTRRETYSQLFDGFEG